jgi:hypothetical protein
LVALRQLRAVLSEDSPADEDKHATGDARRDRDGGAPALAEAVAMLKEAPLRGKQR